MRSVLPLGLMLGEGPAWDAAAQRLWFVDIKKPAVFRFEPASGICDRWDAPAQIGWALPAIDGGVLVGLQHGIHRFDPIAATFTPIHDPEPDLPGNRLNDATIDAQGRVWLGSMDDDEAAATGRIYCLDGGTAYDVGLAPVEITNGPAFSPDGDWLYHTDTLGRRIWRSRIEGRAAVDTELFAEIEEGAGYPDGPVLDAEGCLWTGLFGGWGVRRYDPSGVLMEHVAFPVANVTKLAFGGADLGTAFATTARKGLYSAALAAQPLAGDLFAFDPGVKGLALPRATI